MRTVRLLVLASRLLLIAAPLAILSGCGEGNPLGRRAISGNITFQGAPLDYGAIRFEPVDLANGVGGGAVITNGKYSIGEELGLPPGSYKVWVTAAGTGVEVPLDEAPGETPKNASKDRIPPQYNVQTTLVADVSAAGPTEFNYDLK